MQRIPIHCPCGWDFFVDESASRIFCPRCTRLVAEATPAPATDDTPRKIIVLACVAVGVLVLFLVLMKIVSGGGGREPDARQSSAAPPPSEPPTRAADPSPTQTPSPVKPVVERDVPELPSQPERPPAPKLEPLPPGLSQEAHAKVLSLPRYYRDKCVTLGEIGRMEALTRAGQGTSDDVIWLRQTLALGAIELAWNEVGKLKTEIARLETLALAEPPPDAIVMNDGRSIFGKIVEESPQGIKLERQVAGKPQRATLSRSDVKRIDKGKGPAAEVLQRLERARKGKLTDHLDLAAWAKTQSYEHLRRLAQHLAVLGEPGFQEMRLLVGLQPFNPPPRPARPPEAKPPEAAVPESYANDPLVFWEGKQLPAREMRDLLMKQGYALFAGRWYTRGQVTYAVPDLFKYEALPELSVRLVGTVTGDFIATHKPRYNAPLALWEEDDERMYTRKYYAPEYKISTDLSRSQKPGTCTILKTDHLEPRSGPVLGQPQNAELWLGINCNKPIIEGRIRALAEVDEGRITCSVFVEGTYHEIFKAEARESRTHPLPEAVRGRPELTVVFKMTCLARGRFVTEKRTVSQEVDVEHKRFCPEYRVRLFPSNGTVDEVFRADLIVGEPAPDLNYAFDMAGAAHLLTK